ncbi:hypothetical protein JCM10908_003649 [Rhodotorula pacifica]|uniref:TauD/TfdA dioxygenase family protein n=1 Tax=Rhodotorula pacifica TaxID=1495444 RepID=UPI003175C359
MRGFEVYDVYPHVQSKILKLPTVQQDDSLPLKAKVPFEAPKHRGLFANPALPNLLKEGVERVDLTPSIGTELRNIQLADLNDKARDELAYLVSERGVVFFRDQDLSDEQQGLLFNHFDSIQGQTPEEAARRIHDIKELEEDYRKTYVYYPWKFADAHADGSFSINPPGFSLLKITDTPTGGGGDTVWTSQLYDSLSPAYQEFLLGLKAVHTSLPLFDAKVNIEKRPLSDNPVETHHPLVITHPVTGWRALYYNSNFVSRIARTKYYESQSLEQFLTQHINAAQDHQVRFRWEKNSVALASCYA